jgi:hypothetical protein
MRYHNVAGLPGTFPAELVLRVNVLGLRHGGLVGGRLAIPLGAPAAAGPAAT